MGEPIKQDKGWTKRTPVYKEQGRHGETYTAKRQPVGKQIDIDKIKRKEEPR